MPSGTKIAEGREAEVFEWDENSVLKLYRPGYLGYLSESAALSALERSGGPAPRVFDTVEIDGRTGLVLERLAGRDMLTILERKPWRLFEAARSLADAHLMIHTVEAPRDLPELKEVLSERISEAVSDRALREFALRTLDPLPLGDRLCHGDFHPGNVLLSHERVGVIDWTNSTRGVPEADHARTRLLIGRGDLPPGMSALFRRVVLAGRRVFAATYARVYRRGAPRPPVDVAAWEVAHAAARLWEGIAAETPMLTAFLRSRAR